MHEPHKTPPNHPDQLLTSGEDQHHYRHNSSVVEAQQGPGVPSEWPGSNIFRDYRHSVKRRQTPVSRNVRLSGHRCCQILPLARRGERQRLKGCCPQSVCGRQQGRSSANRPSAPATPLLDVSAFQIQVVRPR